MFHISFPEVGIGSTAPLLTAQTVNQFGQCTLLFDTDLLAPIDLRSQLTQEDQRCKTPQESAEPRVPTPTDDREGTPSGLEAESPSEAASRKEPKPTCAVEDDGGVHDEGKESYYHGVFTPVSVPPRSQLLGMEGESPITAALVSKVVGRQKFRNVVCFFDLNSKEAVAKKPEHNGFDHKETIRMKEGAVVQDLVREGILLLQKRYEPPTEHTPTDVPLDASGSLTLDASGTPRGDRRTWRGHGKRASISMPFSPASGGSGVDVPTSTSPSQAVGSAMQRFVPISPDPAHYNVYDADERGDKEFSVDQRSKCAFDYVVIELKAEVASNVAKMGPPRSDLLLMSLEDVPFKVSIKTPKDAEPKSIRTVYFCPDIVFKSALASLASHFNFKTEPAKDFFVAVVDPGSGKEVKVDEFCNLGTGVGLDGVPTGLRTMQTLYRCGVTALILHMPDGVIVHEDYDVVPPRLGSGKKLMDESEAQLYKEYNVIKTNKYGQAQKRVLGIDGERIYNKRIYAERAKKTRHPVKSIADIQQVHTMPDRPRYMEIEYERHCAYDRDCLECEDDDDREEIVARLRIIMRLLQRRSQTTSTSTSQATAPPPAPDSRSTFFSFFSKK